MIKKYYGIIIGIFIIFFFLLFLSFDLHKTREYTSKIPFLKEKARVTLQTDYKTSQKIFSYMEKNHDIQKIQEYLRESNLSSYLFNSTKYILSKGVHKIGLASPFKEGVIYQMIQLNEDCLSMDLSSIDREMMITVIASTISESEKVMEELKKKTIEEGKEFIKDKNVSVFWYKENSLDKIDYRKVALN